MHTVVDYEVVFFMKQAVLLQPNGCKLSVLLTFTCLSCCLSVLPGRMP